MVKKWFKNKVYLYLYKKFMTNRFKGTTYGMLEHFET